MPPKRTKKPRSNSGVQPPENPKKPCCSKAPDASNPPTDPPPTKQRTKAVATKKTSTRTSKAKKASEALPISNLPALDLLSNSLDSDLERNREIKEIVQDIYERDTVGM